MHISEILEDFANGRAYPVSHQRKEVGKDLCKIGTAHDRAQCVNDMDNACHTTRGTFSKSVPNACQSMPPAYVGATMFEMRPSAITTPQKEPNAPNGRYASTIKAPCDVS